MSEAIHAAAPPPAATASPGPTDGADDETAALVAALRAERDEAQAKAASVDCMREEVTRVRLRLAECVADRDEWKKQHELALGCWHRDVAAVAARADASEAALAALRGVLRDVFESPTLGRAVDIARRALASTERGA